MVVSKGDFNIGGKRLCRQLGLLGKGVIPGHQRHKVGLPQIFILQPLFRQIFQKIILVLHMAADDAQHKISSGHLFNHIQGAGFQNVQLHFPAVVKRAQEFRRSLGNIAGTGNGKAEDLVYRISGLQGQLHLFNLRHNFPGVLQKFPSLLGGYHSLGGAAEYGKAQTVFQILDGFAQGGLGHKQIVRGLGDGGCFFHLQSIIEVQRIHP